MQNKNIKTLVLPDITIKESDIENLTLVNPIEFMSKEENEYFVESLKDRLRKANIQNNWMTLEECEQRLKEQLNL